MLYEHNIYSGVGDYSSDSAGVGASRMDEDELGEGGEEKMDSVLLFDEKTDSFQLYKENGDKVDKYTYTNIIQTSMYISTRP